MRRLILLLVLCGTLVAQEIKRPTTDVNNGAASCGGTVVSDSTSMALAYDTTNPPPNGTSSADVINGWLSPSGYKSAGRVFSGWQSPSGAYSAVTLNVHGSCSTGVSIGGMCEVDYSLNGGSSWTELFTANDFIEQTVTVSIPAGTPVSGLRVRYCITAANDLANPGEETITFFDIWTSGTLLGGGSVTPTSKGSRSRWQF